MDIFVVRITFDFSSGQINFVGGQNFVNQHCFEAKGHFHWNRDSCLKLCPNNSRLFFFFGEYLGSQSGIIF
jgi:hypothetical protein